MDQLLDIAEQHLPRPFFALLNTLQAWLPLVLTICTIYWIITSVIRTASWAVSTMVFFIKYGTLFAIVASLWQFVQDPANAPAGIANMLVGSKGVSSRQRAPAGKNPGATGFFGKSNQVKAGGKVEAQYKEEVEQGRRIVEGVKDYVWDSAQRFMTDRVLPAAQDRQKGDDKAKGKRSK
ncbi:hypothetical protein BKA62DRAFT_681067 [Auriculariales sp. MPI-PUGE-AT-0066]|nr:hypothetical protein BKA62DRAFT_681067 [Auriculariales sp. MPI-PUGE-AT-0066]